MRRLTFNCRHFLISAPLLSWMRRWWKPTFWLFSQPFLNYLVLRCFCSITIARQRWARVAKLATWFIRRRRLLALRHHLPKKSENWKVRIVFCWKDWNTTGCHWLRLRRLCQRLSKKYGPIIKKVRNWPIPVCQRNCIGVILLWRKFWIGWLRMAWREAYFCHKIATVGVQSSNSIHSFSSVVLTRPVSKIGLI